MKKHEFTITFEDRYYNIVRSIIDKYRGRRWHSIVEPIENDEGNYIYHVWFQVKKGRLNYKLCKEVIHNLEEFEIVKIRKES